MIRDVNALPRSLPLLALALGVAILVVQIRVIAGGQTWSDTRYHLEVAPPRLAAATQIQRGDAPLWWDGSGLGVPLASEPSHGAVYPLTWVASSTRALDLVVVAHLLWAALGVAVWARRRASDRSALVAGVLFATTGLIVSVALRGALPGLAHLGWLGAASDALASAQTARQRARAACAIAVLLGAIALAGELALVIDGAILAIVVGARRAAWRWLAAAIAAGLAIGAAQWIPAALQLGRGVGGDVAALPLARLLELVAPGAFGALGDRHVSALAGDAAWAPSLFVGAPLLALAAVRAPSRRVLGFLVGLGVAALLVGRGAWPAWLGAPELQLAVLALVLAVGAADGLDMVVVGQRRARLALAAGGGLALLALLALAALRMQRSELAPALDRALLDGALGVACIAGAVALAWRAPGKHIAIVCALVVAPSVGAQHALAPTIDRMIVDAPSAWAQLAEHVPRPARVYRPAFLDVDRGAGEPQAGTAAELPRGSVEDAVATLAGGSAWRWGLASVRSEDPARSPALDQAWLASAHEGGVLLDRYGVALAILPSTLVGPRKLSALGRRGGWALVELPVAPLASVMAGWRWSSDPDDALGLLFPAGGGTGVPRGTIVLDGAGEAGPTGRTPKPCAIHAWRDGDIALGCATDAPAYAAISSASAPGWIATIDGAPVEWRTADVVRRAVALPVGHHEVRWRYAPPGLAPGLAVAIAGALGAIGLGVLGRRRRRDREDRGCRTTAGEIVN